MIRHDVCHCQQLMGKSGDESFEILLSLFKLLVVNLVAYNYK